MRLEVGLLGVARTGPAGAGSRRARSRARRSSCTPRPRVAAAPSPVPSSSRRARIIGEVHQRTGVVRARRSRAPETSPRQPPRRRPAARRAPARRRRVPPGRDLPRQRLSSARVFVAVLPQPAASTTHCRQTTPRRTQPASVNLGDIGLAPFRPRVAGGAQLRQPRETAAHPLVVDAVGRARGVEAVQFDRLLLERKCLLLEQQLVFLESRPSRGWQASRNRGDRG